MTPIRLTEQEALLSTHTSRSWVALLRTLEARLLRDEQMEFEFDTVEFYEHRPRTFNGNQVEQKCPVFTCIVEPSMRRAMIAALRGRPFPDGVYAAKRKAIEEAMFVLHMQGDIFRLISPDYRIEFVQSVDAARRLKPRGTLPKLSGPFTPRRV